MVLKTLIKNNYICNLNNTKYFIFSCSFISETYSFLFSTWLDWLLAFIIYCLEWFKFTSLKQKIDKWKFLKAHILWYVLTCYFILKLIIKFISNWKLRIKKCREMEKGKDLTNIKYNVFVREVLMDFISINLLLF